MKATDAMKAMDAGFARQQLVGSANPRLSRSPHITRPRLDTCETLVGKWRSQRIEVRRLLLQVLNGELLTFPPTEQMQALRALCAELIDYLSTGHFEIYGRILPRQLRADRELHALLTHILDSLGKSTDAVLGFNDRLQQLDELPPGAMFRQALIRLSRVLLLRFALEEQLLELCGH